MNMKEIRKKATSLTIKPGAMKKTALIRAIQAKEGNPACFQTNIRPCDQNKCCWRADCLK